MSRRGSGKPLKGNNIISQRGGNVEIESLVAKDIYVADVNVSDLVSGDFVFNPIIIESGTINGVSIGSAVAGPSVFTSLQTGSASGTGFNVLFYATTIGDFIRWDPNTSTFYINGNLSVRDETTLGSGNITIIGNTIESINLDGDIILDPNGTGCVVIPAGITQTSSSCDVTFNVTNGVFEAIATQDVKIESLENRLILESHNNIETTTHNGDIKIKTEIGSFLCISGISTGSGSVTITTTVDHHLSIGSTITLYNTDCTPSIDGIKTIISVPTSNTFTVSENVTNSGISGGIIINIDIALIAIGNPYVSFTTVNDHNFNVGDTITLFGTNSTPSLDGIYTVISIADSTHFSISAVTTGTGSDGTATKTLSNELSIESNKISLTGDIDFNNDNCSISLIRDLKIYNTDVSIDDNILTIGGVDNRDSDDNKDKGVEFKWHNGVSSKTGFFGFDDSSNCFTYIPDATITSDTVSGSAGCLNIGNITATQLDLQNGDILNVNQVSVSTLNGAPDLTLTAEDINLNATNDINIPTEVGLTFGGDTNKIEYNSGFCIDSSTNIKLTPNSDVILPSNIGIVLDGNISGTSTQKIESNGTDITINSGDLNLSATGDINIPESVGLTFGGDTNKIEYTGSDLSVLVDGDIDLIPTAGNDITIPCDIGLVFTGDTLDISHTIESNCTDLTITATKTTGTSDINLSAKTNVNIPVNVGLTFANDNLRVSSNGTDFIVDSSGDINLNATSDINIPLNVGLSIGDDSSVLENNGTTLSLITDKNLSETATGNISLISSTGDISLTANQSIIIPQEVDIQFGSSTSNITSNSSGDLIANSNTDIDIVAVNNIGLNSTDLFLTASNKIRIPVNIELEFGSSTEYLSSDGTNLNFSSNNNLNINALLTTISGNLQVNGTTTTVNSTTVTITDPILTLGGTPIIDDNKDRGVEFKWNNGVSNKTGFFGFDDSSGYFTFIPDGTNTSEVFSGSPGGIVIGDIISTNLNLQTGDITNANIINANELHGDPELTLTATQDINLSATNDINIPNNVGLVFGDDSNKIEYISVSDQLTIATDGNLQTNSNQTTISSDTDITLNPSSSVNIPSNIPIEFGGTNNYISSNGTDLALVSDNDITFSSVNIELNATNSIDIPTNIPLNLNSSETSYLISNSSVSLVAEENILLTPGSGFDTRIPVNTGFVFETTGTANKIEYNGTDLCFDSSGNIKLTPAGGDVDITGNITNAIWNGGVVSTIYGGTGKSAWTQGSIVFAGPSSLEEDNSNLFYTNSTNRLSLGSNSGIDHAFTIANSGSISLRNSFVQDQPGIFFQNPNRSYTWNVYRTEGSSSNANFHIAGGINESSSSNLAERFVIEETGTIGINFPSVNATLSTNTLGNPTEITTTLDHDLETGNSVVISGSDSTPSLDGTYTITVTATNKFTIPLDTTSYTQVTTGSVAITHADRVDNSGTIKLHVNGCIKLAQEGLGSSCLILGDTTNLIEVTNSGDFSVAVNQDLDLNLNSSNNINIPSLVGLTFGSDNTFIKYDNSDLCIDSSGDIKLTPAGSDVIITGNLFVTGTTNISGGGSGGSGTVDDYILCLGKGQDLSISLIQTNVADTVDITTPTHNLVNGDSVTISSSDSTPVIDNTYTVTVISSTVIRVGLAGGISVNGSAGNLRSKHVTNPARDVGTCFDWHDGGAVGTSNALEGFFGFDRSSERFTFIPDSTNTADVISGSLGDLEFNKGYFTNVEISTLTSSQVVFSDSNGLLVSDSGMTYNSTTNTLTVDQVEATNLVEKEDFDANTILKADTDNTPVPLSVPENTILGRIAGGSITALTSSQVNSLLGTSGGGGGGSSFERLYVIVSSSISSIGLGTPSTITTSANHGLTSSDSVTISGSNSTPSIDGTYSVTVTGTNTFTIPSPSVTIVGSSGTITPDDNPNPNNSDLVSFINILGDSAIASGTLAAGSDGEFKQIFLSSSNSSSSYELTLTLLDPGTSTVASKKLIFTCAGQSSHLIYDNVISSWIIVNSGAFVD
jgi:hypothetical protein